MTYRRILVPFDGSRHSKKALDEALGLARLTGGTIYLCTVIYIGSVVPPGSLLGLVKSASKGELQKRLLRSAKAEAVKLQKAQLSYCKSKGVKAYHKIVIDGNVAEEILVIAKRTSIDIIVIGSQGLHGIGKVKSLGSVSRKVSELATCPVLIVR
jgi:nucleotide-binding universal stress UspA family protein